MLGVTFSTDEVVGGTTLIAIEDAVQGVDTAGDGIAEEVDIED